MIRFISLANFPSGFNADEASFGYDAYSILHTGHDQWGGFLPIVLKSFGDYKAPVYSYLAIPSIAAFGLNVFSTRLPNVLVGSLAVLTVYLLVRKLSKSEILGNLAAVLLAFNPWSVMISRGAVEANLIVLFLPLGIYLFLIKKYSWSALVFGIGMFTYHSAKVITPVVVLGLLAIYKDDLVKIGFKKIIPAALIFTLFLLGMIYTFKVGGGARISERSITDGALEQGFQERMAAISKGEGSFLSKLLHNKYQVIAVRFVDNYLQYSSPKFLFENGAGDGSYAMIPGIGIIYVFEGLLFVGILPFILLDKKHRNIILGLFLWLLLSPIPSALASGVGYSGNRASAMMPVVQILEAFGGMGWYLLLKRFNRKVFFGLTAAFAVLMIFEIVGFTKAYFKLPSNTVLRQMDYGNLEVMAWLAQNSNGKNIILSRSLSEPQIFVAFADRWNPKDYQLSTKNWNVETWVDQIPEYKLGQYTIESVNWKNSINSLVVVRADELPNNQNPTKTFYLPDGTPNIYIVDTSQKTYAKAE